MLELVRLWGGNADEMPYTTEYSLKALYFTCDQHGSTWCLFQSCFACTCESVGVDIGTKTPFPMLSTHWHNSNATCSISALLLLLTLTYQRWIFADAPLIGIVSNMNWANTVIPWQLQTNRPGTTVMTHYDACPTTISELLIWWN